MRIDYIAGVNGAIATTIPILEAALAQKENEVTRLRNFIAHAKLMASEGESVADAPALREALGEALHPALSDERSEAVDNVEAQAAELAKGMEEARDVPEG